MSGPIVPPLTVSDEADGGSVSGRPITTIEVTSGTLTVSGRVATLDTSGSGGSPATPANSIQFNSDPAGTFSGSERLLFETGSNNAQIFIKSGASATQTEIRAVDGWGMQIGATNADNTIRNQIVLFGENDGPDGILLIPNTGENVTLQTGGLTTSASDGDLVLSTYGDEDKAKITLTAGADGDILVQTDNTGVLQLENTTTDADSVLSIMGNGTGDAKLDLQNASKRVWVLCDENKKLKIQGGAAGNTFVFDVTTATGGIQFPDGTSLISAEGTAILATGVTDGYVLTADGAGASAWEAAGGGGADNIFLAGVRTTFAGNSRYNLGMQSPWVTGSNSVTTGSIAWGDNGYMWPFLYPLDGAITEFGVKFGSTGGSGGVKLAVYASDTDGVPNTMLARGDIADGGASNTYTTTIVGPSSGAASSASAGDLCWLALTRYDGSTDTTIAVGPFGNTGMIGPVTGPDGTSPNTYVLTAYNASTTWPDTLSTTTASTDNNYRPRITIKVA